MVQGGYVSQSQSKQLTINKKSNVLDKSVPKGQKSSIASATSIASNASNNNESSSGEQIVGASVCFIFTLINKSVNI